MNQNSNIWQFRVFYLYHFWWYIIFIKSVFQVKLKGVDQDKGGKNVSCICSIFSERWRYVYWTDRAFTGESEAASNREGDFDTSKKAIYFGILGNGRYAPRSAVQGERIESK